MHADSDHLWGIVLAGGDGRRLQQFIQTHFGSNRPKQFCAITGTRSMLQHTLDRASMLIKREHLVTVAKKQHESYVREQLFEQSGASIILQPTGHDTGVAALLALMHIYHREPDAFVALLPSDHFILEEDIFSEHIQDAFAFAAIHSEMLVLLGAQAEFPETEYGWIERGSEVVRNNGRSIHRVKQFWEKPRLEVAQELYVQDCLWNTSVVVGYVPAFLDAYQTQIPDVFKSMERIDESMGSDPQEKTVIDMYEHLPSVNFSHCILERKPESLCVMRVSGVHWSDWGCERHIRSDLRHYNLRLNKSCEPLTSSLFTPIDIGYQKGYGSTRGRIHSEAYIQR